MKRGGFEGSTQTRAFGLKKDKTSKSNTHNYLCDIDSFFHEVYYISFWYLVLQKPVYEVEGESQNQSSDEKSTKGGEVDARNYEIFEIEAGEGKGMDLEIGDEPGDYIKSG